MNQKQILIFAGTTEGRELAEYLSRHSVNAFVRTATEYGETLLPRGEFLSTQAGRMDQSQMEQFIKEHNIAIVIDATHPYAVIASENIKKACEAAGTVYKRLLRKSQRGKAELSSSGKSDCIWVRSIDEAVAYLNQTKGNIFVTTGSKELACLKKLENYQNRVYARVLCTREAVSFCNEIGITGKHLICMQGPFCEELNYALLKQVSASFLLTKESGQAGGFMEKIRAARRADVSVIIIGRQKEETGYGIEEIRAYLIKEIGFCAVRQIKLVGIGMGNPEEMTRKAQNVCNQADILIGAKRMIESVNLPGKAYYLAYEGSQMADFLLKHPEYERIAIVLSGDPGFYSGAKKIIEECRKMHLCEEDQIEVVCGISSVVYFCGKLKIPWEDVTLMSLHGRKQNVVQRVKENQKVFILIGSKNGVNELCRELVDYGLTQVKVCVGEHLSYEDEKITTGTPKELLRKEFDSLSVVYIENRDKKMLPVTYGLQDEAFFRGKVPMTKSEIRSISLSKLGLTQNAVIYDVGAGTGSVAVEMARISKEGMVYAIEKKEEAMELIKENKRRFQVSNLCVIGGTAPDVLKELPSPTHVFIGGSSGNIKEILFCIWEKNPWARIVINAIALETIAEVITVLKQKSVSNLDIVTVSVGKAKTVGEYHMMMGNNPVTILSFTGAEEKGREEPL